MQTDLLPNKSFKESWVLITVILKQSPQKLLKILERTNLKAQQNNRHKEGWTEPNHESMLLLLRASCKATAWAQGDLPGQTLPASGNLKLEDSWATRNNCFLVSTSSQKAFYPWLSVTLLWAHFSPRQAEPSGAQSRATPTRDAGENGLPFVCSELAAWLFHLMTPDLLADAPMKNQSFLRSLFATSEMPPLAFPPPVTSPQAAVPTYLISSHTKAIPRTWASLSPCCSSPVATSFWSSDGCILHAFLIFSESQCLGKRVILMTQPHMVHTQTYAFAHTLQKGNVHFKSIHH